MSIVALVAQHAVDDGGHVPGDGYVRDLPALGAAEPIVFALRPGALGLIMTDDFGERPTQVFVGGGGQMAAEPFAGAGLRSRRHAGVGREVARRGEPGDVEHLAGDEQTEVRADAGDGPPRPKEGPTRRPVTSSAGVLRSAETWS